MTKKVAFIISHGHSGSSLLAVIMGSHPKCFSGGEIKGLHNHYRNKKPIDCVNQNSDFWLKTFGKEGLEQLAKVFGDVRIHSRIPLRLDRLLHQVTNRAHIFNPYSTIFSNLPQFEVIVDSSKAIYWMEKRLKAQEFKTEAIEPYLLYLVRDGRAVINSFLRKYPHWDIEPAILKWVKRTQESEAFFRDFNPKRKAKIAYEELASNSQKVIGSVCQLLDLDYRPEMLEYWKHEHHDISGNDGTYALIQRYQNLAKSERGVNEYYHDSNFEIRLDLRWTRELSEEKQAIFERIAGDVNRPYEWNI